MISSRLATPPILGLRRLRLLSAAEELDAVRDDLDGAPPLALRVDLLQLDVRGEIADQRDAVHGSLLLRDVAPTLALENARNCAETAPTRATGHWGTLSRLGVWRSLVARSVRVGEVPSSNL